MPYHLENIDTLDARQFLIAIKKLADSLSYGTDTSPFLGSGTEYVQSRLYQPGDPIRSIDWRITARTQKYHVKQFETPKQMSCYLVIDTSASMTISSTHRSKYANAVHIAGGLALACLDRISPVAVVGAGEKELRYSPSLSRDKILQWLHKLRHYHVNEQTTLYDRLRELGPLLLNRSLVIVMSDLHQPDAIGPLKRMAQKHDVIAIQFVDPAEQRLRGLGFVRGREAETGQPMTTRGSRMGIDQESLQQELKRARVDHLVLPTDEPFAWRLRHFCKSRGVIGRSSQ